MQEASRNPWAKSAQGPREPDMRSITGEGSRPLAERHLDETIGVEELAAHWDKPAPSILSDRTRAPWRVPPICSPIGARPLRWRVGTVLAFDREQEEIALQVRREAMSRRIAKPVRSRGRPRKGTGPKELAAAARLGKIPSLHSAHGDRE